MILFRRNNGLLLANGLLLLSVYMANAQPWIPSVFTKSLQCSRIGKNLLAKGGSVVDVAISTYFCETLNTLQGFALGGGFVMKIWDNQAKEGSILIATPEIPDSGKKRKFEEASGESSIGLSSKNKKLKESSEEESTEQLDSTEEPASKQSFENEALSEESVTVKQDKGKLPKREEGIRVEIPGVIAGFWAAHQKYGRLAWAELFNNIIAISIYPDDPNKVVDPKLIDTLRKIRDKGKDVFYSGQIAIDLVNEIQEAGGLTTLDDFKNYQPEWEENDSVPKNFENRAKTSFSVPHVSVEGPEGSCVTVSSINQYIPRSTFKSESTGVILLEC